LAMTNWSTVPKMIKCSLPEWIKLHPQGTSNAEDYKTCLMMGFRDAAWQAILEQEAPTDDDYLIHGPGAAVLTKVARSRVTPAKSKSSPPASVSAKKTSSPAK
jgi:hypothetical protein